MRISLEQFAILMFLFPVKFFLPVRLWERTGSPSVNERKVVKEKQSIKEAWPHIQKLVRTKFNFWWKARFIVRGWE